MFTRVMEAQAMGGTDREVAWLARGMAYLIGTQRLGEEGFGSMEDYRRTWYSVLEENGRFPDASSLVTPKSYEQAVASFGDESCSIIAELTADDLVTSHGWQRRGARGRRRGKGFPQRLRHERFKFCLVGHVAPYA